MKTLKISSIVLILLVRVNSFSQSNNSDCIQSRWISLKLSTENAALFSNESKKSMLASIQKMYEENSEQHALLIYNKKNNSMSQQCRLTKDVNEDYTLLEESTTPLANMYGEDSTVTLNDGNISFIYPPSKEFKFSSKDVVEIRMKEDRILNKETNQYVYVPIEFSIVVLRNGFNMEVFWIDVRELIRDPSNKYTDWAQTILNKKYKGFQYQQTPCQE